MEWVETTGRTLEEAKGAALDLLGVDEVDADFEVVDDAKMGLFGRLRVEARVRARVRPTIPRPKDERRDRRRRSETFGGTSADDAKGEPAEDDRSGGIPAGEAAEAASGGPVSGMSGASAPSPSMPARPASRSGAPGRGDRTSSSPRSSSQDRERRRNDGSRRASDAERKEPMNLVEVPLEEQGERAREFVQGLVNAFGMTGVAASAPVDEQTVEVSVTGEDLGLLIGPKGATLAAIQDLTRTAVQRHSIARTGRIVVDIAGYRQRRRVALERFTRQVADEVLGSGEPSALETMSPADRKVVHDTANEIEGVTSTSEGEEPRRRVVISPI